MNPAAARILDQLRTPDRVGRDLALLRTRLYRFSDDLRWYVLAEALEEHLLSGRQPHPSTIGAVRTCLEQIRRKGSPSAFQGAFAAAENIDIRTALAERAAYMWQQIPLTTPPSTVVLIVGAPRSGTSHLYNLLAATGKFAYLTTATCWAWPVRNLHRPGRQPFTTVGDAVLEVDNKHTRIIPGLIMPGEAEDIWDRAMPVYRHIRGHLYGISSGDATGELRILQAAARAHLAYFQRTVLLAKSPFNSFRIPQIERLWGDAVIYIHIVRDQHEVAYSMRRNHFEFAVDGQLLTAEEAWSRFVGAVRRDAPADRTTTIRHEQLLSNPRQAVALIESAIGESASRLSSSRPDRNVQSESLLADQCRQGQRGSDGLPARPLSNAAPSPESLALSADVPRCPAVPARLPCSGQNADCVSPDTGRAGRGT